MAFGTLYGLCPHKLNSMLLSPSSLHSSVAVELVMFNKSTRQVKPLTLAKFVDKVTKLSYLLLEKLEATYWNLLQC